MGTELKKSYGLFLEYFASQIISAWLQYSGFRVWSIFQTMFWTF